MDERLRELKEASFESLREADGGNGLTFEIVIIREGRSKNGTYYPKETLLKSRTLFEGAKVAAYEWNGMFDHLSSGARSVIPDGFPSKICGILENVRFSKLSEGCYGLIGTLRLTESNRWLAEIFKLGLESGNKDVLGFSIDILGKATEKIVEGEKVQYIEEIGIVNEVTVVTNPAAGGRLERMVASMTASKGESVKEDFLRFISAFRPKALDGVSFQEATEERVKGIATEVVTECRKMFTENQPMMAALGAVMQAIESGDLVAAKGAIQGAIDCFNELINSAATAGTMTVKTESASHNEGEKTVNEEEKKAAEEKAKLEAEAKAKAEGETKTVLESIQKRQEEADKRICEATLRANLAESKLPEAAKTRIRERFTGKIFQESELTKEIEAEVKYCASLAESLHPNGLHVEMGETSQDKLADAVEGMLLNKDVNKIPRFVSIHEAFSKTDKVSPFSKNFKERLWTNIKSGANDVNAKRSEVGFKEAIQTSTFGQILADVLHKSMVKEYTEEGLEDWRKVVTIGAPLQDFQTRHVTRLGGYGTNMPTVAEAGPYTDLVSPTDEESSYAATKKGGLETISWEAIRNDNLRALQMIPSRLGRGCKNTIYQFVFDFFRANAAVYDGTAFFHADHGNLGSAALAYSAFGAAIVAMMDQAAYNEANFYLRPAPKFLLVPNELVETALEIANANVSSSSGRTETVQNTFGRFGLEVVPVPYWTDATDWCLVSDPSRCPTIEIAFLDGNEEPELLQEAANAGTDFTNDQVRYKVRHIYGGAVVEYRGARKHVVA